MRSTMYKAEASFGVNKNTKYKTLSSIEKGSDMERAVHIRAEGIKEKIDMSKMTPEEMIKLGDATDDVGRLAYTLKAHQEYRRQLNLQHGIHVEYRANRVTKVNIDDRAIEAMGIDDASRKAEFTKVLHDTVKNEGSIEDFTKWAHDLYEEARINTRNMADASFDRSNRNVSKASSQMRNMEFKSPEETYD